jgi:hypothetical protein
MIFGISCVRLSIRSEPGAGISARWMASAEPSSKRRPMRVEKALRRKPITRRLMIRKMMVPRRILEIERTAVARRGGMQEEVVD